MAHIVVGLGFGDEGKGGIVDYLVREHEAKVVVRYNGGGQAGHNVVLPESPFRSHVFSQWGSGTLAGAKTYLSRFMVVHPLAMLSEAEKLVSMGIQKPLELLLVDERALVTTAYHQALNRLRELSRKGRHGSCGAGVGETVAGSLDADAGPPLIVKDLSDQKTILAKLMDYRARKLTEAKELAAEASWSSPNQASILVLNELKIFSDESLIEPQASLLHEIGQRWGKIVRAGEENSVLSEGTIVFEGAQGVLLDEWRGFHPYTTWSTTTSKNAKTILAESGWSGEADTVGVLRAFSTRHGAGPFPSEDASLEACYGHGTEHNTLGDWQGSFRYGHFDSRLTNYALEVDGGVDFLALTCVDRVKQYEKWKMVTAYKTDSYDGGLTYLPVLRGTDLRPQEFLTGVLMGAKPLTYTSLKDPSPAALVEAIETASGKKVRILSEGPTWKDKSRWKR